MGYVFTCSSVVGVSRFFSVSRNTHCYPASSGSGEGTFLACFCSADQRKTEEEMKKTVLFSSSAVSVSARSMLLYRRGGCNALN